MPTFTDTANEMITRAEVSQAPSAATWCLWPRWLTVMAGLVLLSLCLPSLGMLRAQTMPQELAIQRKLVASTSEGFGSALTVSGDVLVAAAPTSTVDGKITAGAVYVFVRDQKPGEWVERKRLVAQDGAAFDLFGKKVAIDRDTVVVGASQARIGGVFQQGTAYVFERQAGGVDNWGQSAKLTDDTVRSIAWFGSSVAVQGDLIAVGAPRGNPEGFVVAGNGSVTIFERDRGGPGAWGKVTTIPAVGGGSTFSLEYFGTAVALDGDLLLVGASRADVSYFGEDDGAAYVFRRNSANRDRWDFVARLTAPEATLCPGGRTLTEVPPESQAAVQTCALREDSRTDHDAFGSTMVLAGDTVIVGAPFAEAATGQVVGAAYVFRQDAASTDRWDQVAKLTGSDILAASYPGFGGALALAGDTLLVGAASAVGPNGGQGAAYLFKRNAGGPDAWGEIGKLVAGDGLLWDRFGSGVAFDGENAIVGAGGYTADEMAPGAVYLAGDPPPEVPPEPAFPSTGQLTNDGIVEGPGGVLLGMVGTPLAEPLPVWIQEVPPPAEPLASMTRPLGAFYNIGAARTTSTSGDAPFGLALPVPVGADTAHLAAVVLIAAEGVLEGARHFWMPVLGFYNPETNLFSFALPTLFVEGSIVVLVEAPDLAPLSEPTMGLRSSADVPPDLQPEPKFVVICVSDRFTDPSKCTAEDERIMADHLQTAHDDYHSLGYGNPTAAIPSKGYQTKTSTDRNVLARIDLPAYYVFVSELGFGPDICGDFILGEYIDLEQLIWICYDRALGDTLLRAVIRHEVFHSFQFVSPEFSADTRLPDTYTHERVENFHWIKEGTAAAAEQSSGQTIRRNTVPVRPLHPINRSLLASDAVLPTESSTKIAYSAQDFWVYFGKKKGLGLGYLKELFSRGASPGATDVFFNETHQTSLAEQYWGWVKNQAIEKTIKFDDEALSNPACSIDLVVDTPVVGTPRLPFMVPVPGSFPTLLFPNLEGQPEFAKGTLPRLTAKVVKIDIVENVGPIKVIVRPESGFPRRDLVYKVYKDEEEGCVDVKDGERKFDQGLEKNSVVYVILANTQYEAGSRVRYSVEVSFAH